MFRYKKGSRVERDLLNYFHFHGFLVVRAAGSGSNSYSPDILVFKKGKQYAFELKAHETNILTIKEHQFNLLKQWEKIGGISTFIVWKKSRLPYLFIPLSFLKKAKKHYNITLENALNAYRKEDLIY